jgi:hypothetical protein
MLSSSQFDPVRTLHPIRPTLGVQPFNLKYLRLRPEFSTLAIFQALCSGSEQIASTQLTKDFSGQWGKIISGKLLPVENFATLDNFELVSGIAI